MSTEVIMYPYCVAAGAQDKRGDAKSRAAEQQKEQEALRAAQAAAAAAQAEGEAGGAAGAGEDGESPTAPLTEEERREKRLEDGIGVPHIMVDCAVEKEPAGVVLGSPRLPSVEEVRQIHLQSISF